MGFYSQMQYVLQILCLHSCILQYHSRRIWCRSLLLGPVERRTRKVVQFRRPGNLDFDRCVFNLCWICWTCWWISLYLAYWLQKREQAPAFRQCDKFVLFCIFYIMYSICTLICLFIKVKLTQRTLMFPGTLVKILVFLSFEIYNILFSQLTDGSLWARYVFKWWHLCSVRMNLILFTSLELLNTKIRRKKNIVTSVWCF